MLFIFRYSYLFTFCKPKQRFVYIFKKRFKVTNGVTDVRSRPRE
jgi:hypothetical protein